MREATRRPGIAALLLAAVAATRSACGQAPVAPESDVPPVVTRQAWEHPEGPPPPQISPPMLGRRGFATFGWIDAGIGANSWGSPFNGPITFPDRSWQGQVTQVYLATERVADADRGAWDWGGRVDLLLGTDSIFTTARGLDAYSFQRYGIENVASWSFTKDYGLAMPQLYADVARGDVGLRFGPATAVSRPVSPNGTRSISISSGDSTTGGRAVCGRSISATTMATSSRSRSAT